MGVGATPALRTVKRTASCNLSVQRSCVLCTVMAAAQLRAIVSVPQYTPSKEA